MIQNKKRDSTYIGRKKRRQLRKETAREEGQMEFPAFTPGVGSFKCFRCDTEVER